MTGRVVPDEDDMGSTEKGKKIVRYGRVTDDSRINEIMYNNRDKRFYGTIVYDSCTWLSGELVTLCCQGNLWAGVRKDQADSWYTTASGYNLFPLFGRTHIIFIRYYPPSQFNFDKITDLQRRGVFFLYTIFVLCRFIPRFCLSIHFINDKILVYHPGILRHLVIIGGRMFMKFLLVFMSRIIRIIILYWLV